MSGTLTHSPADVVRHLLIDLSYGTLPTDSGSWPIYATQEPDSSDDCITVFDVEGEHHGRTAIDGEVYEYPGIQVRVRAASQTAGYTKAQAVAVALDKESTLVSVTVGSSVYVIYCVSRKGTILALGKEPQTDRSLFTINAVVAIRQLS